MHEFALGPPPSAAATETPIAFSSGVTSPPPGGNLPRAATLRKSFRKTLKTHMGFRVRMRTVFVPYFLLPQGSYNGKVHKPRQADPGASDSDSDLDEDVLQEREQREGAGQLGNGAMARIPAGQRLATIDKTLPSKKYGQLIARLPCRHAKIRTHHVHP